MEKLELKHLVPYLPYGLKASYQDAICLLDGISSDSISVVTNDGGEYTSFPHIKPILRPLSDLTKEIEHNDERFVPIEEIAKLGTRELKCYVTNSNIGTCYVDAEFRKKGFFMYHSNGYFIWQVGKNAEEQTVYNQLELFQKLFSWHFDVFGLIDKGLGIDINTLK